MVRAAIDKLKKQMPMRETTDIDRLIGSLKEHIRIVHGHVNMIDKAVRDAGQNHDPVALKEQCQKFYLERLYPYNREELLLLMVCLLSDQTVADFI